MPIPPRARPPTSIAVSRSDQSTAYCRKPTRSLPRLQLSEWHRRWRATHPLHCVFRRAPSHRDYRQAQPDRADKAGPKANAPFLLLSRQSVDLPHPNEASASPRKPRKRQYLPVWRKIFHAMRRTGACLAAAGLSMVHQKTDARHRHRAAISSARPTANRLAGYPSCSLFVLYDIFRVCGVAFFSLKTFMLIQGLEEAA